MPACISLGGLEIKCFYFVMLDRSTLLLDLDVFLVFPLCSRSFYASFSLRFLSDTRRRSRPSRPPILRIRAKSHGRVWDSFGHSGACFLFVLSSSVKCRVELCRVILLLLYLHFVRDVITSHVLNHLQTTFVVRWSALFLFRLESVRV